MTKEKCEGCQYLSDGDHCDFWYVQIEIIEGCDCNE